MVLRLLSHPELQFLATTALISLLGTWTRSAVVDSAANRAVRDAAQSDIAQVGNTALAACSGMKFIVVEC